MKKIIVSLLVLFVVQECWAQDFVARIQRRQRVKPQVIVLQPRADGALVRAVRAANPLDMVNPYATRAYGDGQALVYYDENDPFQGAGGRKSRAQGIRVLSIDW
jgi:hypothetical protein